MFNDQVLQNSHSQLPDVWISLQALGYLSQEQAHKEMVPAVVLSKAILQTLVCKMLLFLLVLLVLQTVLTTKFIIKKYCKAAPFKLLDKQ